MPSNIHRTLAFPHYLSQDDMYEGYHIPAGSVVVGNVWYELFLLNSHDFFTNFPL